MSTTGNYNTGRQTLVNTIGNYKKKPLVSVTVNCKKELSVYTNHRKLQEKITNNYHNKIQEGTMVKTTGNYMKNHW